MMTTDGRTVFLVVLFLGLASLVALISMPILAFHHVTVPEGLMTLGGVALGGLTGLLAKTSTHTTPGEDSGTPIAAGTPVGDLLVTSPDSPATPTAPATQEAPPADTAARFSDPARTATGADGYPPTPKQNMAYPKST
jgi:hypothetical protein